MKLLTLHFYRLEQLLVRLVTEYTDADESELAAECLRDSDIGDSSLSLSDDR